MRRGPTLLTLLVGMGSGLACDDAASTTGTGGDAATASSTSSASTASASTGTGGSAGITWTPCPVVTDGAGSAAECALLDVPADWSKPDGPTVTFSVKRVLGSQQPARAQVWFMNGGPGGSVVDFEPIVEYLHDFDPTFDWYMPEHRGVGLSSRLSCPTEEASASDGGWAVTPAEAPACIAYLQATWGERLAGFTSENAAHDVGETIAATRAPGQDVFLYGISYGSHWGNRYLQLYPDQATGVSLGALAVNLSFTTIDEEFNQVGERLMGACAADAFCASKLGPDPWARMTAVMSALDQGHCPEVQAWGIDRTLVRQLAASFTYDWYERTLVPPLVYRLERCSAADMNAIGHLVDLLIAGNEAPPTASERNTSILLGYHVGLSEMWADPAPPLSELQAYVDAANFSGDASVDMAKLHDVWPRYTPNPALAGKFAATSIPILLEHGEYDFIGQAQYQPFVDALSGPHQSFVLYPRATHDPWSATTADGGSCGLIDLYYFLLDPLAPPDPACLAQVVPIDFGVPPEVATAYLGTADAWEGDPDPPSMLASRAPSAVKRAVRSRTARGGLRAAR